ncbi:hypothetical protein BS50DRAFT_478181 [Corynespora cassiicola Philippines]|uniref:Uncharacterized protein n=1 Tax=Corynespora cassiicola Philippines TaxID=1448308 RepID=A0A2T2PD40_CORCC|nr:hypothetical protein BS50DRAFT_478181 [Corynespora cassiicola Philippines]
MADVRSMLRKERQARQPAKPPKTSAAPATEPASRKRKAADDGTEERKRTRTEVAAGVPAGFFDGKDADAGADVEADDDDAPTAEAPEQQPGSPQPPPSAAELESPPQNETKEEDLDAFLAEMEQEAPAKQPSTGKPNLSAYSAGAVIQSAPMTVAEIAAQARDEQSAQRARRDEEMEGEKEDAARQLEDEFEEMDGLEARVKKLREQREALRLKHAQAEPEDIVLATPQPEEEDESESDDEDWDDWRFH